MFGLTVISALSCRVLVSENRVLLVILERVLASISDALNEPILAVEILAVDICATSVLTVIEETVLA